MIAEGKGFDTGCPVIWRDDDLDDDDDYDDDDDIAGQVLFALFTCLLNM